MSWNSVKSIGQNLTTVISSKIEKSVNQVQQVAANTSAFSSFSLSGPEEIQLGRHTVTVKHRIAEGGFGVVDLVHDNFSQKEYALKRCNVERQDIYETVNKEIQYLNSLSQVSEHIVKIYDSCITTKNGIQIALILLENCVNGHLLNYLNNREGKYLKKFEILSFFKQICESVKVFHCHNPPLVHRDLKLENVLMTNNYTLLKLCDFGSVSHTPQTYLSSQERENVQEIINRTTTQMYRAPEMCDLYFRNSLTDKTDIWALGCIFFSLCFLKHPFQDMSSLGIIGGKYTIPKGFKKIKFSINDADNNQNNNNGFDQFNDNNNQNTNNLQNLNNYSAGSLDDVADEECIELISRLLDVDPEARPNILELTQWVDCMLNHQPLPQHFISELALKYREKRIEANKVRSQIVKRAPPTLNVTVSVPSVNSAAAKRLKARGLGHNLVNNNLISSDELDFSSNIDTNNNINSNLSTASTDLFSSGNDFDPFASSNPPTSSSIPPTISGENNNDFFSNNSSKKISSADSLFEDFNDDPPTKSSVHSTSFSTPSTPFNSSVPVSTGFDAFDNDVNFSAPQTSSSSKGNNAFESFDMFDSPLNKNNNNNSNNNTTSFSSSTSSFSSSTSFTPSSTKQKQVTNPFAPSNTSTAPTSTPAPTPAPTPAKPATNFSSFDNFSSTTTTSSSSLDIFESQPSPPKNTVQLLDDIFGSGPALPPSPVVTPTSSSAPTLTASSSSNSSSSSLSSDFDLLSLNIPKPPPKPAKPVKKTEELLSLYNQAPPPPTNPNYFGVPNRAAPPLQYQRPGMYQAQKPKDPFENLSKL